MLTPGQPHKVAFAFQLPFGFQLVVQHFTPARRIISDEYAVRLLAHEGGY
jgi:hypothetical protein